jgi:hypothetical protein
VISSQQLKQLSGTLREDSLELNRINNFSIARHPTASEGGPATTAVPRSRLLARNDFGYPTQEGAAPERDNQTSSRTIISGNSLRHQSTALAAFSRGSFATLSRFPPVISQLIMPSDAAFENPSHHAGFWDIGALKQKTCFCCLPLRMPASGRSHRPPLSAC